MGTSPVTAAIVHAKPIVRQSLFKRLVKNPLGLFAMVYLFAMLFMAIFAPVISPYDPLLTDPLAIMTPPDGVHLLGTDSAGRDVLSRLFYGAQTTLISAAVVVVVAVLVGVPTGLIAGYYGGKFDGISSWLSNAIMALPAIIVLLAVRTAIGPSILLLMAVFGLIIAPGFFRLTRPQLAHRFFC